MFALLLLVVVQDPALSPPEPPATSASFLTRAHDLMAAEQRCAPNPSTTDITICGMRGADRFRVPFIVHDAGDPRHESVTAERVRLLNRRSPVQDMGPFQVEGGMAGVTVGVGAAGVTAGGFRKPAP